MKDSRVPFFRLVATAVAIVLILFAVMGVLGASHLASFPLVLTGKVVADLFRYLPPTLELIVVSFFVASTVGFVSALPSARSIKPLVTSIALGLQCIPLFWLAIAMELVLGGFLRLPMGGFEGADRINLAGHLSRLILPAAVLTMFQFPLVVEYFNDHPALGMTTRAEAASIVGGLAAQLVNNLPDIIPATMITEIVFTWPGEGRLLWDSLLRQHAAVPLASFLVFMALFVLVTRFLVEAFAQHRKQAADSHV